MNGDGHDTYWGERLKTEVKADIQALSSKIEALAVRTVTHKELLAWSATLLTVALGAGAFAARGAAAAAARAEANILETRKDIRSLYRERRTERPQARLEAAPEPAKVDAP